MRNTLQQDEKEALEKVCGKKSEAKEVEHMTLEGMQKELKENTKHQMEYVLLLLLQISFLILFQMLLLHLVVMCFSFDIFVLISFLIL